MVRLDRLVNVLGGYGVRLTGGRVPRSTELRHVALPETLGGRAVAGDVLLAVGATSVAEAVRWAEAARAVVVMVKVDETAEDVVESATADVAVMTVDPAVSWSELAGVVYGLVLEGRETESGRGPTDLFSLADSVAEAIGGAVTIEDRQSRVLAYSGLQQHADRARVETILGRQAPDRLRRLFEESGVFAHIAASDEPLFIPEDAEHGLTGRMVAAVRAGREVLGSVWVTAAAPLRGPRRQALVDAARTVALHLLRTRVSADLERQIESDLVTRLLEGTADAATVMSRLGLPPGPMRVIAVRPRGERQAGLLLTFERATTGFGWSRPGRSALDGTTVYTVLPGEGAAAAQRWTDGLRAALPPAMTLAAGISAVATMTDLPAARQEADECLALHERRPADAPPPVYDESWHDVLLQRVRTAARTGRAPARGPVADLRRHDREHGTRYVETLRAWLAAQGDPAVAGQQLGVHENTVRNRLRRMATMTNLDLQDAGRRLAMMIELAVDESSPEHRQSQWYKNTRCGCGTATTADPGSWPILASVAGSRLGLRRRCAVGGERIGSPRSAVVVGAGIVGLSTAWFLQERGVEVTVVDRAGVAAGASWGNAGWISPGLTIPLNEPGVLRYGLRSLLSPTAPLHVPATADPTLWSFLLRFAANCRWSSWTRAAHANLPFNDECIEAFDVLTAGGVEAETIEAPITAAFAGPRQAQGLLTELRRLADAGQPVDYTVLSGQELREHVPLGGPALTAGVRINKQRYVDPGRFVQALGRSVVARGATIQTIEVADIQTHGATVSVRGRDGTTVTADVVVLATGAWLSRLAGRHGVRVPVRAGRGYSFTVPVQRPVPGPLYLPDVRVACTPYQDALRVAGTMEFRDPDAPVVPARLAAIIASARPLLDGVRWDERTDVWVGPRPVTTDGRPLIGATRTPGLYVAGGHGMWGLTHGPITGRLLAEQITTGKEPAALHDVSPLR